MTDALNLFLHHKANIDALLAEIATASSNRFHSVNMPLLAQVTHWNP